MPTIKLTYFDLGGRALAIRLAFAIGRIPYEDERIAFDKWPTINEDRTRFPLGSLPVITVDSRVFAESHAIFVYAGLISGLAPADPLDALAIEQALLTAEEIYSGEHGFAHSLHERDHERKKLLREKFLNENLLFHARRLNTLLEQSGTGYFGKNLSIADLRVFCVMAHFKGGDVDHVPTTVFDQFPLLTALCDKVKAHPAVQEYLRAHPNDV